MSAQIFSYYHVDSNLKVYYQDRTFWMTLESIAKLFKSDSKIVFKTLKEILNSENFSEEEINRSIEILSKNGTKLFANSYNLDIVMAIGYRLNIKEATKFRIWCINMFLEGIKIQNSFKAWTKKTLLSIF